MSTLALAVGLLIGALIAHRKTKNDTPVQIATAILALAMTISFLDFIF